MPDGQRNENAGAAAQGGKASETKLAFNNLTLDKEKIAVYFGQKEITISQPEYLLLLLLMENKGSTIAPLTPVYGKFFIGCNSFFQSAKTILQYRPRTGDIHPQEIPAARAEPVSG